MSLAILPTTSERAPLRPYVPSAKDRQLIEDAQAFISMTAPFFAHILYSEMKIVFTREVPWAATDAHSIFLNVDGMKAEGWGIEEIAFVIVHEIMHYVFGDLLVSVYWRLAKTIFTGTRTLPYLPVIMNRSMDFRINAALVEGRIGKMPMKDGRPFGCFDPAMSAEGMEDCVTIYDTQFGNDNQPKPRPGQGQPGQGEPQQGGFDEHLEPSKADQELDRQVGEHRRSQVIAAAVQAHNASGVGDLPAAIRQLIDEVLNPKVRWADHLRATMARSAGEPRSDPRSINKRAISRPVGGRIVMSSRSKYGCGTVVVGWDTSGSVLKHQSAFFAEMSGIVADLNPQRLIVIRCDAKVHAVDELEQPSDLLELRQKVNEEGIGGGGGTKFEPVFTWLEQHDIEPDMLVYLTDLEGSFPRREPHYPTIWANIKRGKKAPFGTIVEVEV